MTVKTLIEYKGHEGTTEEHRNTKTRETWLSGLLNKLGK